MNAVCRSIVHGLSARTLGRCSPVGTDPYRTGRTTGTDSGPPRQGTLGMSVESARAVDTTCCLSGEKTYWFQRLQAATAGWTLHATSRIRAAHPSQSRTGGQNRDGLHHGRITGASAQPTAVWPRACAWSKLRQTGLD